MTKELKPTVFNLPQNPLSIKSFKYNYIKNKIEHARSKTVTNSNQLLRASKTSAPRVGFVNARSAYIRNKEVIRKHHERSVNSKSIVARAVKGKSAFEIGCDLPIAQ